MLQSSLQGWWTRPSSTFSENRHIFAHDFPRFRHRLIVELGVFFMKRCLVALFIMLCLLPAHPVRAEELRLETPLIGAALMDAGGKTILHDLYADAPFDVAGLTKFPAILTLAQAFDEGMIRPETEMHVSRRAADISGPTAFLEEGETIAASELIKAAIMISAGDAILTLGENAFGSESVFIENINATLRLCGIDRTMTDACGNGMQFSAKELALLGCVALKSDTFQKYCLLYRDMVRHPDGRETELVNANRMIRSYTGCKGLVTGSSGTSTYCGVFAAERSGTAFVAVVIGAETANDRFAAAETMLNHGFANYVSKELCKAGTVFAEGVAVQDGTERRVNLVAGEDVRLLLPKAAEQQLQQTLNVPDLLVAPIDPAAALGSIDFTDASGSTIASVPLYADREVLAFGWKDIFSAIIGSFLGGA